MTRKARLSALDKARIEYTHHRLMQVTRLIIFARRAGGVTKTMVSTLEALNSDHEKALQGRKVPRFDAFGGRGEWAERQAA